MTNAIGARDFSATMIKRLAARGVAVVGIQAVPGFPGDRYFSGTAYVLNDNGTHRLRSHAEVRALAA